MSPRQVEKHMSYELLFKALLFAVVKMASFPSFMSFIPYNLESWGDRQACKAALNGDPYRLRQMANRNLMKFNNSMKSPAAGKEEAHAAIQAISILGCIGGSTVSRWREINIPLYWALLRPAGTASMYGAPSARKTLINCSETGLVQLQEEKVWGGHQITTNTYEEIVEEMDPGSSQQWMAGG